MATALTLLVPAVFLTILPFLAAPAAAAGLNDVSFSAPLQTTGATETWTIAFSTVGGTGLAGDVRIVFPGGFNVGALALCDIAGLTGETTFRVSSTEVICELSAGSALTAGTPYTLTLTLVTNPGTAQTTEAFTLQTRTALNTVVDSHATNTETIVASILPAFALGAPTQRAGAVETWTLVFTTVNPIPANGDIRIVFPTGFTLSSGAATVCNVIAPSTVLAESTTISGQQAICSLGGLDAIAENTAVTLTLSQIKSPTAAGTTGTFTVQTRDAADAVQDHHVTNVESIAPNLLSSVSIFAPQQAAGAVETWTFQFTTFNPLATGGDVRILLPAGFATSAAGATVCDLAAKTGESTTVVGPTEVVCELNTATLAAGESVALTLTQIQNPGVAQTSAAFTLQTRDAANAVQDQHASATVATVAAGLTGVAVSAPSQLVGALEAWTIQFTTTNPVEATGDIRVVFPSGFETSSGAASECSIASKTGESTTVVSATEIVCELNGADLAAGETIALTVSNIKNPTVPQTTAAFILQTRDSKDLVVDAHTGNTESIADGGSVASSSGASTLSGFAASAPLQSTGRVETWTLSFTTVHEVPAQGDIRIVLPNGFTTSTGAATVCDVGGTSLESTVVVSAREVRCDLNLASLAAGQAVSLTLSSIQNPSTAQTSGAFAVQTRDAVDAVLDEHLTNTEAIVASAFTSASASAPWQRYGATETWTFTLGITNPVGAGGDVRILFPSGFQTSNGAASVCDFPSKTGETTALVGAQEVICELGASNSLAVGTITLTITNIRAPLSAQTTAPFTFQTRSAADQVHDQSASLSVSIGSGAMSGFSLSAPKQTVGSVETWTVSFVIGNAVQPGGDARMVLPSGFLASSAVATVCDVHGKSGETTQVLSPTEILCHMNSFGLSPGESVRISYTNIKNPPHAQTTGPVTFQVRSPSDVVQEQAPANTETILAHPMAAASVVAADANASSLTRYDLTARLANPLPADGRLVIVLPNHYGVPAVAELQPTFAVDLIAAGGLGPAQTSGNTITLPRVGGTDLPAGAVLKIGLFSIQNPAHGGAAGLFRLATQTKALQDIDVAEAAGPKIQGPLPSLEQLPAVFDQPFLPGPEEEASLESGSGEADARAVAPAGDGPQKIRLAPGPGPVGLLLGLTLVAVAFARRRRA